MKTNLLIALSAVYLFGMPFSNFAQTINLGSAASFTLFTTNGAFNNTGVSDVVGDIGTNVGAFTGFPPGLITGQVFIADPITASVSADIAAAYNQIGNLSCLVPITLPLGNNQTLTPNVYCIEGAALINGDLVLNGEGNPRAVFIFKVNGALSTSALSKIVLSNAATSCKVYWMVNGAFVSGENSVFKGTTLVNGAITMNSGSSLEGRVLSKSGAVNIFTTNVKLPTDCATTSLSNIDNAKGEITIAPNPFKMQTNIIVNNPSNTDISELIVYNALGIRVLSKELNSVSTSVETSRLPSGIYLYTILVHDKIIQSGKLISEQ